MKNELRLRGQELHDERQDSKDKDGRRLRWTVIEDVRVSQTRWAFSLAKAINSENFAKPGKFESEPNRTNIGQMTKSDGAGQSKH